MLVVALQENCLAPTISLWVTEKRLPSFLKGLTELSLTVFLQGPCPCTVVSQSTAAVPPALLMPLTCHSGASLEPQGHRVPWDCSGPTHAHGPSRLQAASCRKVCCWLTLCTVAQAADANSDILVLTPSSCLEAPAMQGSSVWELTLWVSFDQWQTVKFSHLSLYFHIFFLGMSLVTK